MKGLELNVTKQNGMTLVEYRLGTADVYDDRVADKVAPLGNIVPFQYKDEDGKRSVISYVHKDNSLEMMLKQTLKKADVLAILKGLLCAFEVGAAGVQICYLVRDTNYIYVDPESLAVKCLMVPVKQDPLGQSDIPDFFRNIVSRMRFDEADRDNYVARILTLINEDHYSNMKLRELVDVEMEKMNLLYTRDEGIKKDTSAIPETPNKEIKVNRVGVMNNMRPQGQPMPPMGGQPMPPTGGQPMPPMGQPMPPMGRQPMPPMGGQPMPPMGGQPMPSMGGQPMPPMGGQPMPPMGQPMPPMGQPMPPMGQPMPPMGGQPMPQGMPVPPMGQAPRMPTPEASKPQEMPKPEISKPQGMPVPPMGQAPQMPKPEAPKPEMPKPQGMPVPPMGQAPQMPKPEAPKPEMPKPEAPKPQEMPKPEMPKPQGMPVPPMGQAPQMPKPQGMPVPPMGQAPQMPKPEAPKPQGMPKPEMPKPQGMPVPPMGQAPQMPKPQGMPVPPMGQAPQMPNGSLMGQLSGARPVPHLVRKTTGEVINITKSEFVLGKSKTKADYTIENNNAISREHCTIIQHDGVNYIKDNNSTNHTYVNGVELQPGKEVLLKHKTDIRMGDEEFVFLLRKGE
ncbi:MAG: FHA domain-containing protein [Lachnospiraceae bacterium]|nr:FHA domain-containing protein [Lachnospiraceae bacterium]